VAAQRIVCKSRAVLISVDDLSVRHKAQLYKGLEAVADAAHESVVLVQELRDALRHGSVPEERVDEFRRTVRLVSAGESARYEDDLCLFQRSRERLYRPRDLIGSAVLDNHYLRPSACLTHRACAVIFAVCAREYRYEHLWLCTLEHRCVPAARFVFNIADRACHSGRECREHCLEPALIESEQLGESHALRAVRDLPLRVSVSEELHVEGESAEIRVVCYLEHHAAVAVSEYAAEVDLLEAESDAVAVAHLHHCLSDSSDARSVCRDCLAGGDQLVDLVPQPYERARLRESPACAFARLINIRLKEHYSVAGPFELRRNDVSGLSHCDRERNKCRRNVEILEGAAHGVLASYGADSESHLGFERSEQSRERLAPSCSVLLRRAEVLLEREVHFPEGRSCRNQFRDRFDDREVSAVVRRRLGYIRVVAPCHERAVVCLTLLERDLVHHRLDRRDLVDSSERHQHRARPDGGVEALRQSLL